MRLLLVSFWTIKAVIAEMFYEIIIILTPIAEQARSNTVGLVEIKSSMLQT